MTGLENPADGQRDGGDVVGERPEQVPLDRRQRAPRQARSRRPPARRSPETNVRSLASMATSVPVPMAMPRSDWARAGASFTPSPIAATRRPSACSRAHDVDLLAREHFGDDLVDPHLGVRPRGRCASRSPVTMIVVSPSSCERVDRGSRRRLHGVGHHERAADRAVPSGVDDRAVRRRVRSRVELPAGRRQRTRARPTRTVTPSTTASTPSPAWLAKSPGTANAAPRARAPAAIAFAIGCSDASSTDPRAVQQLGVVDAGSGHHVGELHPTFGDGAGLVEHRGVDRPGRLQHLTALDHDAELRAPPGADHDGGRGREAQARTGRR